MSDKQKMPMRKPATTKGQPTPLFHVDDWDMLLQFKRNVAGMIVTAGAANYTELAASVGQAASSVSGFLRTDFQNMVSRHQQIAAMVGCRIEFTLFIDHESPRTPEMELMERLTLPRLNHKWQRMFLNERLTDVRANKGLGDKEFGQLMGIGAEAAREQEQQHDWRVPSLFRRVRTLGGALTWRLVPCD